MLAWSALTAPGPVLRPARRIEQVAVPETLSELSVTPTEVFHTISTVLFEGMLTAEARVNGPLAPL
jgi:hypothetical protein